MKLEGSSKEERRRKMIIFVALTTMSVSNPKQLFIFCLFEKKEGSETVY
jgi:hypothetical protein